MTKLYITLVTFLLPVLSYGQETPLGDKSLRLDRIQYLRGELQTCSGSEVLLRLTANSELDELRKIEAQLNIALSDCLIRNKSKQEEASN